MRINYNPVTMRMSRIQHVADPNALDPREWEWYEIPANPHRHYLCIVADDPSQTVSIAFEQAIWSDEAPKLPPAFWTLEYGTYNYVWGPIPPPSNEIYISGHCIVITGGDASPLPPSASPRS